MVDASSRPSGFTAITPNPYIVGNPVRNPAMFFGREAEFELVRKRFSQSDMGLLLVFCGERRSGKTSILFQILDGRLGAGFVPVLIDMQSMAIESEVAFLVRISEEIRRQLGGNDCEVEAPDFSTTAKPSAVFYAFIERLLTSHPGRKLLLMFDEYELLENKIDSGVITEEVLHILGGLMESHPVFLLFTGSHELEKRRRDYWRAFLPKSDFRTISYLQHDDAVRLITQPLAGRVHYEEGIVDSIYRLTSGQPFYTQAICQRLVDYLNDHQDLAVTRDVLGEVSKDIVENPLPQMIFLWDGFAGEEKIVLSLLAEELADATCFASAGRLAASVSKAKYPVRTPVHRMATALEHLFKSEFLLKDRATPSGYAFRMDLWRLWINRMHSVWQVMLETGAASGPSRSGRPWRMLVGSASAAALVLVGVWRLMPRGPDPPPIPRKVDLSQLTVVARPEGARIFIDGEEAGQGMVTQEVAADRNHQIRVAAPGYADSLFMAETVQIPALTRSVSLRPLLGELRIESDPSGAQVSIDGIDRGTTPIAVTGLPVTAMHTVALIYHGRETVSEEVAVSAEQMTRKRYVLRPLTGEVLVSSTPSGATLDVDGVSEGTTPVTLKAVGVGKHRFTLRHAGFESADTVFNVGLGNQYWHQTLSTIPPGTLVVLGDLPARIFVDDKLVVANVLNSGQRSYPPGWHEIRAELVDGTRVIESVEVKPGEVVTFDYSQRQVISRTAEGGGP